MSDKKQSIFEKIAAMTHAAADGYLDNLKKSNPTVTKQPYGSKFMSMRRSWDEDMERLSGEYGYKQKLTLLTDQHKLLMFLKDPIVSAIVLKRTTQVCNFHSPQKNKYDPGFIWELRNPDEHMNEKDDKVQLNKEIELLNNFITNCGIMDEERSEADEEMTFKRWLTLSTKDTLIYDSLAIEIVPDHTGKVHHWVPVSGATARLAAPNLDHKQINDAIFDKIHPNTPMDPNKLKEGRYKYVQVVAGQIRKAFTKDDLILEFRNPVNDFFTNGYPIGELDLLLNVVSAHLNADNYNRSIFTNGITASGIINLKGDVDEEQLKAMRRSWYAQSIGVDAMLRTPIVNTPEGIEFIKLDVSHKDLEYSNYINYLIKLICAIFQISPEEIGFTTGGKDEGAGNSQNYSNVESKILMSQEAGLRPILGFFEDIINEKILPKFNKELHKKYRFKFVGLNAEDRMAELTRLEKEGKVFKSLNEIRKEQGLPPIQGADNLILDSVYYQWFSSMSPEGQKFQKDQADQMAAQSSDGGGDASGAAPEGPNVQYIDEDGNPIDPNDIDPESMQFQDEEGNEVNSNGEPIEDQAAVGENAKLPFEQEGADEAKDTSLPFEAGADSHTGNKDDKKLPFE